MIIGVDIDEVLFPCKKVYYEYINKKLGANLDWRNSDYMTLGRFDLSREEEDKLYSEFVSSDLFKDVRPIEGAIFGVERLREIEEIEELYAITARPNYLKEITKNSLDTYFPEMFNGIEFGNHHNYLDPNNERTKREIIEKLEVGLMIEDQIKYVKELSEIIPVILFDCPWNQNFEAPNVYRAKNWSKVTELAKEITNP